MKVKAHLHLPKAKAKNPACISVSPFAYKKGESVQYFGTVTLRDVRFKVSQPGRNRTLDTGVKNVHAWVVGEMVEAEHSQLHPRKNNVWKKAKYNPRIAGSFFDDFTNEPIESAQAAMLVGSTVYYL